MELIHNSRGRAEDFGKLVIVNDSFSEENIHVSKEWYCLEHENFIYLHGISGCIPERFCMNKQVYSENGSVSKSIQEDEVLMDKKEVDFYGENFLLLGVPQHYWIGKYISININQRLQ